MIDQKLKGKILLAVAAAFLAIVGSARAQSSAAPAKSDAPASGDAKHGQQIFRSHGCYQCHGYEGQGAPGTGARIGPPPLPLASFKSYVRSPKGQMPPYGEKILSDAEVADIYAYLQTKPKAAPAKSIPILSN